MVDPEAGGMEKFMNPGEHTNAFFRLDPDNTLHKILDGCVVPNGTSWTYDDKTMYWTDTPSGIFAFDYDSESGAMSNKRIFLKPQGDSKTTAAPDGHVMDEEEHLWVSLCGSGKVVRVNPKGEIVAEVLLPDCPNVTCPCFVGTELWITSIGAGSDAGKHGGALFKVDVGVKGKKKPEFKLKQ